MTFRNGLIAVLLVTLAHLQYRLWVGEGSFAHVDGLAQRVTSAEAGNEAKRRRNDVLKAEILDLRDGTGAIEARARLEWGLIKEGETFYQLVDSEDR